MMLNRTALVADESDRVRKEQSEILRALGFFVVEARDGFQVLERLRRMQPALVVMDLALQGLDGGEVLHFLRRNEDWAGIPVVVCSARTDAATRRQVAQVEGAVFLEKPCPPESLRREVSRLFQIREVESPAPPKGEPESASESEEEWALLVSDREETREGLGRLLEDEGYDVVTAINTDRALSEIGRKGQPGMVVVDWGSHAREALRLVEILRRCRFGPQPTVLMVCQPLDIRAMAAGARAGVDHSLGEPITRTILVERLKQLGLR
jgi:DNA-binding response OmpR family regulator